MKKTIELLLLLFISITGNAQIAANLSIYEPDSAVYYTDSVENTRYMLMINKYDGDSIDVAAYWYDNDTIIYATKSVYYMNKDLPILPFEPIFAGGANGTSSGYSYVYTSTIGDTLSKSYKYDFGLESWVRKSKTKHNISTEGIDTLAITHIWDENLKSWQLNNVMKQEYIDNIADTLKILMLAPNLTDTINNDIISYEYNLEGQKSIIREKTYGSLYLSIDSITYNELGLINFIYYGNNNECVNSQLPDCENQYKYDYAEQYFYDTDSRLDKIYLWNKQGGLADWEFDGYFQYYYSKQETGIEKTGLENSYSFYPNPCKDVLTIESFTGKIEVYNLMGQLMISEQIENGGLINTSSLPNGIYVVKPGELYSKLITKQ